MVDLCFVTPECFQLSLLAKGNGDLWWIINLSLRPGLVVRDDGLAVRRAAFVPPLADDVLLSRDPATVCHFLGVPELWDAASERPVAVSSARAVEIAAAARFFQREAFTSRFAEESREFRVRVQRRPMLGRFKEWLVARPGPAQAALADSAADELGRGSSTSFSVAQQVRRHCLGESECWRAATAFGATEALAQAVAEAAIMEREREFKRACQARLNGNVVLALLPGLCGKDVGRVLATIHDSSGSWEACSAWLDAASREELEARVLLSASALQIVVQPLASPRTLSMTPST